jgi:tetratricopeptide (TPR) repeat protein
LQMRMRRSNRNGKLSTKAKSMNTIQILVRVLPIALLMVCRLLAEEVPSMSELDFQIQFKEANQSFADERDFQYALDQYLEILDQRGPSVPLLQNIANSYFKLDQLGQARLYCERALLISPGNPDLTNNLRVVLEALSIEAETNQSLLDRIEKQFTQTEWFISFAVFINIPLLYILAILIRTRANRIDRPKFGLFPATAILMWMIAGLCLFMSIQSSRHLNMGIVVQPDTSILQSPFENAEVIGSVSEGFKLKSLDEHNGFYLVKIPDGNTKGWISNERFSRLGM